MKAAFGIIFSTLFIFTSCKQPESKKPINSEKIATSASEVSADSDTVYKTDNLIINRLAAHTYQHISYLNTDDYGRVPSNGMVVINENKAIIFDSPTDDSSSLELINYVTQNLKSKVIAVIPTHFHKDCVGGLQEFYNDSISIYASQNTLDLLKKQEPHFKLPIKAFKDSLTLNLGNKKVYAEYLGEGHTKDNIIGYFPEDNIMFGGCLIKEMGAAKGYLGDANTTAWPKTVQKLSIKYPNVQIVIPGHGAVGGTELFTYTINLFE